MQKIKNYIEKIKEKVKTWSLRKKIIYIIIIIVLILISIMIFRPKDNSANITTDIAKTIDLKQTVLATGQVTSNTDLNLSFFSSGIVRKVNVKVGDIVKAGQVLATLDQGNELATLTQARGAVAAAQARYQSILDGASNEEINLAKIALNNAHKNLLNTAPEALPYDNSNDYTAPTISGSYNKETEGQIILTIYPSSSLSGYSFRTKGIINTSGSVTQSTAEPIGDSGLFIKFPSGNINVTEWVINIPNTKAINYITNYNAYQAAKAELALREASARKADIELAKANILTAQGQLEGAMANLEHTILRAPINGTITNIDIKTGELTQALKNAMTLQDVNSIYLEANINEANITNIKIGAPVDITFDAFGTDQVFKGTILTIDPSSTIISGVVNYKITANVLNTANLRPGMTANMTILVGEKYGVLTIPSRAIIKDKNGVKTVRLINNPKTKTYKEVGVTTGMEGDGGLVEITSGISTGEEVVVLIKK